MDYAYFFGWAYAICWGVSFYPTLYLNYSLKRSDSISMDYLVLNILGYLCYSISIYLQLRSETIRHEYQLLFDGKMPVLSSCDLFYAFHGLTLLTLLLTQVIFGNSVWKFKNQRKHFKIHRLTKLVLLCSLILAILSFKYSDPRTKYFKLVMNLAYFKILTSLIKYIPQVIYNYRRKSMHGISNLQIWLDLLGVIFCFSEFYLKNDVPFWEAVDSNRGKLGIACVTFIFSTVFLTQIFIYGTELKIGTSTSNIGKEMVEKTGDELV